MSKKLPPEIRRDDIMSAALTLSERVGYTHVTRDALAAALLVSPALISRHFGTMVQLRRAIMSAAVARSNLKVIAQGLALGDSKARNVSVDVKEQAVRGLL